MSESSSVLGEVSSRDWIFRIHFSCAGVECSLCIDILCCVIDKFCIYWVSMDPEVMKLFTYGLEPLHLILRLRHSWQARGIRQPGGCSSMSQKYLKLCSRLIRSFDPDIRVT
jgi:hypothetical protein